MQIHGGNIKKTKDKNIKINNKDKKGLEKLTNESLKALYSITRL